MGLFKKREPKDLHSVASRGANFWFPGTPEDFVELLVGYGSNHPDSLGTNGTLIQNYLETYGNQYGVSVDPPASPGLYAQFVSNNKIIFRAGSKFLEYWRVEISFAPTGDGVQGTALLIKNPADTKGMWRVNIMRIFHGLRYALKDAGGRIDQWE